MAAGTIVKEESRELEREVLSFDLPSPPEPLYPRTEVLGTSDKPIDLTMDEADSERHLNTKMLGTQLERSSLHYPSMTTTTSIGQDIEFDMVSPVANDKDQGDRTPDEGNTDFQMQEEEAAVEKAIAAASPSLASGDDTSLADNARPDVKTESAEDWDMLQLMFPTHTSRLHVDHLDLIYEIDRAKMVCRLCVYVRFYNDHFLILYPCLRISKGTSVIPRSFLVHTPQHRLLDHCETEHPVQTARMARMTPEKIASIRRKLTCIKKRHGA